MGYSYSFHRFAISVLVTSFMPYSCPLWPAAVALIPAHAVLVFSCVLSSRRKWHASAYHRYMTGFGISQRENRSVDHMQSSFHLRRDTLPGWSLWLLSSDADSLYVCWFINRGFINIACVLEKHVIYNLEYHWKNEREAPLVTCHAESLGWQKFLWNDVWVSKYKLWSPETSPVIYFSVLLL